MAAVVVVVVVVVVVIVVVVLLKGDEKVSAFVEGAFEGAVALGPLIVSSVEGADNGQVVVMVINRKQDETTTGEVVVTLGVEIRRYVLSVCLQFRFDVGS